MKLSKKILLAVLICFSIQPKITAQTCNIFTDDFSNAAPWTQVGTGVVVTNNRVEFQNNSPGGQQRRVYRSIGTTLNSNDVWSADVDFHYDNSASGVAHMPFSVTAGTQEPFNNCPNVSCTGYPLPVQDMIGVVYRSFTSRSLDRSFALVAAEGTGSLEYASPPIFTVGNNTTFYLRAERLSSTKLILAVFSDAARTVHLSGSPVTLNIPSTIEGLTTVQHGNIAEAGTPRQFNGWLDNVCISSDLALPVNLVEFSGKKTGKTIDIAWETSSELNCRGFELQKSTTNGSWQTLEFVDGQGITTTPTKYNSKDYQPFHGSNFYRLKQIDFDGSYTYSEVISVEYGNSGIAINVYPNPCSRLATINIKNPSAQRIKVEVVNSLGVCVWESARIGSEANWLKTIEISEPGIYFVVVQIGKETRYERLIVSGNE